MLAVTPVCQEVRWIVSDFVFGHINGQAEKFFDAGKVPGFESDLTEPLSVEWHARTGIHKYRLEFVILKVTDGFR